MAYSKTLLSNLPRFIRHTPQSQEFIGVYHGQGIEYTVTSTTLRVRIGSREAIDCDLGTHTIAQVCAWLRDQGCAITALDQDTTTLSGHVLLEGQGGPSTEVLILGSVSPLEAWARSVGHALDAAEADTEAMTAQMILPQTYQEWTDYWGQYFGVARTLAEADATYTQRIIDEVSRQRNNDLAMENNIARYLDRVVDIYEPWRRMWTLSVSSKLDGGDHLPGAYYAYHVIHPKTRETVDWSRVLDIIHADRPAGTLVWTPSTPRAGQIVQCNIGAEWKHVRNHFDRLKQQQFRLLTDAYLSVNATLDATLIVHIPNHLYGHYYNRGLLNEFHADLAWGYQHTATTFARILVRGGETDQWNDQTWDECAHIEGNDYTADTWDYRTTALTWETLSQTHHHGPDAYGTGVESAGAVGALEVAGNLPDSLAGLASTGAVGTLTAGIGHATALVGVESAGAAHAVLADQDGLQDLGPLQATGAVGALGIAWGDSVTLAGVAGTGATADLRHEVRGDAHLAGTGAEGTGAVGTLTLVCNQPDPLAGQETTGAAGALDAVGNLPDSFEGLETLGAVGTVTITGNASSPSTQATGTGEVGTLAASGSIAVRLTQQKANPVVGTLTATAQINCTVTPDGTYAHGNGAVGTVEVYSIFPTEPLG